MDPCHETSLQEILRILVSVFEDIIETSSLYCMNNSLKKYFFALTSNLISVSMTDSLHSLDKEGGI